MAQDLIHAHAEWMRLRGLRRATIIERTNGLRRCGRLIGKSLQDATAEDLHGWQAQIRVSAVTHACNVSHLCNFFRWMVDEGHRTDNPSIRLIRPKRPRTIPRPVDEETLVEVIPVAPPVVRCAVVLAAFAGLRAGEIARLQRCDVLDTAKPPVLLVDGKGGKQRVVPISGYLLAELHHFGMPHRGVLLPHHTGRPGGYTPEDMSHYVARWLHGHGFDATLHMFRHRFGTRLYHMSHDLRVVQTALGHADPSTTAGYVAYSNAELVSAVNLLGDWTQEAG